MADHDHRAGVALQPRLEPDERVEVEVVGRLVEQHQVGRAHQRAGELQPHPPAAGEAVHRRVELGRLEAQAEQHGLRARPGVEAAGVADRVVRLGHRVAVVGGFGRAPAAPRLRHQRACRPASTKSVAPWSVSGISCATSPMRQRGGIETSPASVCSRPASSENSDDLPAPLRPTRPTFSPGCSVDAGAIEHQLDAAPQRDLIENEHRDSCSAGVHSGSFDRAASASRGRPRSTT